MLLTIALAVCLFLMSGGCGTAKHATQADIPYRTYADVPMTQIGVWTRTDVYVPKGAMVAVIAEGECWRGKEPNKRKLDPTACLRFKIGERGVRRNLGRFYGSQHVSVVKSTADGPFCYILAPFLKEKRNWQANLSATVLVWEKAHADRIQSDIHDLILAHPDQKKFQALLFPLAGCFTLSGEYSRAEKVLKELRETTDKGSREAILALTLSAENEKWLRRYGGAKEYAEEALVISRSAGLKGLQGEALLDLSEANWHLGQREEAIKLSEEALRLSGEVRLGSNYLAGRSHQLMGQFYLNTNRVPEAVEQFEKAVDCLKKSKAWRPLAQSYFMLGQAQRRSDMKEQARKSYELSVKFAGAIGRSETLWRAYSQLGRLAEHQGDRQKAFKHYADAITLIEEMRGELSDPGLKAIFMENKFQVYEWMIRLLHGMKRDEEAFNYLERAKARTMLDMLGDKTFASRNAEMEDLLTKERSVREQLQELMRGSGQGPPQEGEEEAA
jgi:tetratricopeptide (TPR) repeat protein